MVQIQSSWFPLFDRNPQKFINIFEADENDFQKTINRIYYSEKYPSKFSFGVFRLKCVINITIRNPNYL